MSLTPVTAYLQETTATHKDLATELSYRAPLQKLLTAFAKQISPDNPVRVLHEPKRSGNLGAPDFLLTNHSGAAIGYVECKKPGEDLQALIGGSQLEKYRRLSPNIMLTDYWHFILLQDGKIAIQTTLSAATNHKQAVSQLLQQFLTAPAQLIGDAKTLAQSLAARCALLRQGLTRRLPDDKSSLRGLLGAFQQLIYYDIDQSQFADALAQTLVYGLLLAKLKAPAGQPVNLYNIEQYIPQNFALIREITGFLKKLESSEDADIHYLTQDILAVINAIDHAALAESMSYKRRDLGQDDDPYIYFYENFLAEYDAKLREARGVYYTPPPVVKFIVRATDDILRRDFNLPNGLAEQQVTVLDFAAGTGTFLLEMFRHVIADKAPAKRDLLTHQHLLKNFYGFEFLIAPYAIAHLKLSQFLTDLGVSLTKDERINVFLTNTLEELSNQPAVNFMPAMSEEAEQAQKIKAQKILVITGNPPYSGHSQNKNKWIAHLMKNYKEVDGSPLGEKNPKWLQDDYVKFIRFAQWKMAQVEQGVVAIITNHGFLDNPTFRGMRQSLTTTFDRLYFLDLHGNARKRETAPDGGKDENVFDIQQGVAISLLIKKKGLAKGVFHGDFWGQRKDKYTQCMEQNIDSIEWQKINPVSPSYLFIPHDTKTAALYKKFHSLTDIFRINSVGIVTARDSLTLNFERDKLEMQIKQFAEMAAEHARDYYNLGKDSRDWKIILAQKDLIDSGISENNFCKISYRPFDIRETYYTGKSRGFHCMPRGEVMKHMLAGDNIGLISVRQAKAGTTWQHCFVSDGLMESSYISNKTGEINYIFPLYICDPDMYKADRKENIKEDFRKWIDARYGKKHSAEDILGCIYAILHSPDYRRRYKYFLRIDFPRIDFPKENAEFKRLAKIGNALIQAHLLKENCTGKIELCGSGTSHLVEKITHDEKNNRLYFNQDEYLCGISKELWDFQIGGYQALAKWLKSRKGRNISHELTTLEKAANAINYTIKKMKEIDK